MRKAIILITALAVLLTCPVLQAVAADSPEAAATAYMTALKQNKVDEFVAMMHPDALAQFKKMMMPVVILAAEKDKEKQVMQLFKGVADPKALAALSPADVFKAFYNGLLAMIPNLREALAGSKMQVLGHVNEGSDMAHVVYRATMKVGQIDVEKVEVMSFKKHDGKWMALLGGNLEGLAAQIRRQMTQTLQR